MFKKSKLSSVINLILAGTMAMTLSACQDGDTVATTTSAEVGNNFVRVANPVGTVIGVVQDIQGNPIAGATVSIGGRSVVTAIGGTYQFKDIPVTDVVVNTSDSFDGSDTNAVIDNALGNTSQRLLVTIVPPSGYLGAVVSLTPTASVLDYGGDGSCADTGATTVTTTCTNLDTETFIDGFVAQAGTAVLPALNSTVTGILRDATTGVELANTDVTLEMTQTYGGTAADTVVLSNGAFDGVSVSYAVRNLTTTTDDNGLFTFENVPSKSSLEPKVAGYTVANVQTNNGLTGAISISTQDWTSAIEVGAVMVTPIVSALDTIRPFVTRVNTVTNGTPGLFNDDVDLTASGTGIVIHFNEPIAESIDIATLENSVEIMVWDDTGAAAGDGVLDLDETAAAAYVTPVSISKATDNKSITVIMPSNLTEGQSIHVNLLNIDFTDLSGNPLTTNGAATMTYDSALTGASNGNGSFTRLAMTTFVEINKTATAVTVAQNNLDVTGEAIDTVTLAKNDVFKDVQHGNAIIQQLNATDDDGIGASEASARLTALYSAIGGPVTTVDGDQALITFTPSDASAYMLLIANEFGVNQPAGLGGPTVTDLAGNLAGLAPGIAFTPVDANPVNLVLNDVEVDWTVQIIPLDDLFYPYPADPPLTLIDTVEPTTVLQTSYGVGINSNFLVTGDTFGEGGELANDGTVQGGTPILNVTVQLLDNLSADGTETVLLGNDDNSLNMELVANNTVDTLGTGLPFITAGYDAAAYTAMTNPLVSARTMGIAFSENITKVTDPAAVGTVTLSNWTAMNDVLSNDRNVAVNVDLMTADVDSVFTLAENDGLFIDFADDVSDGTNASVAAVNPRVMIRDAMPPFIESGTYDGDSVTLVFNEVVVPADLDTFGFQNGTNAILSVFPDNLDITAVNYTLVGNTLTIDSDAWGDDLALATAFPLPTYVVNTIGVHGTFTYYDIEDQNENDWSDIDGPGISVLPGSFGIPAIPFLLESAVDTNMTVVVTDQLDAAITSTIVVTSTHRIDTTLLTGTKEDTAITGAQLFAAGTGIAVFNDAGAANVIDPANSSATLSADGRTLTITLVDGNAVPVAFDIGDEVVITVTSDWDSTQSDTDNSVL